MTHPAARELLHSLGRHPAFQEVLRELAAGRNGPHRLSGLVPTAKALYAVLLWEAAERPVVLVTPTPQEAETLTELVASFFELVARSRGLSGPQLLPAFDVLPFQRLSPHSEISEQRAVALWRLAAGRAPLTVTPLAAALWRLEPPEFYRSLALHVRTGDELSLEDFVAHLEATGYEKRDPVEMVGDYSVRGGIVDVFSPEATRPVRVEFFGDQIESLRRFDVETQRSVLRIEDCLILPLSETPKSRELFAALEEQGVVGRMPHPPGPFPGWEFCVPLVRSRRDTLFSLAPGALVVWDEPEQLARAAEQFWLRLTEAPGAECPPERIYWQWEELVSSAAGSPQVAFCELDLGETVRRIATRPSVAFHGNMRVAVAETRNFLERGGRVVFFAASSGELERLADIFREYELPCQLGVEPADGTPPYLAERAYLAGAVTNLFLLKGRIRRGAVFADSNVAFFGFEDLFDVSQIVAQPPRRALTRFSTELADLKPGDYVVHAEHGVGRFLGLRELVQDGQKGDFMLLEYADAARLYVPLTRLDLVHKYRGVGEAAPPLDKLGGVTWARTRRRIKARMRDMAEELLKLYAARKLAPGFAFSPDSNWQREFEDAFEFEETEDQLAAIRDIKRDMERPEPMDRLLCGDVGFGKTEVAMRAAFKALGDGKQVAVLAPTTVLCFQHYETFKSRFAPFPVRVEMLSRFLSPKQRRSVLEDLAAGKVDIIIGTHRLLSKDVEFRDLGLLIIDEEQRFGVRHKERLKQLRKDVDVLTMTATPIPRTLHMALLGLRDMSVIETPPKDRLAVHTVVAHFDPALIRSAVEQELARGGQVYFVHNRIETLWSRAALLQELVPHCRIAVAHGRMREAELEKVMLGFMRHQYDLLACTTIVENGLDIPLANTIIIDHAERYGLAELYQLRGRVGRSNRRAYAYLLVPPEAELTETARKRLAALKEFSELGAGFKIAALDLELRGAGNLLGGEQHGHINAVGYETYVRLLEETMRELKGEPAPLEVHTTLNLGLDLRIPPDYIADEQQRLRAYKRIAEVSDPEAAARILADLRDRYGPPPDAVAQLVQFALLKSVAERLGIVSIERRSGALHLKFHPESPVDPAGLMELVRRTPGAQFTPAGVLRLPLDGDLRPEAVLESLHQRLADLGRRSGAPAPAPELVR
ncbi:MAG: transcription-repair coupling factor [Bryobacterales bacterium]|nr:transcription-repair coupling factor [Bryobacteraceae bacterium]MDW8353638.1 transcription-repair coupling factor [Bryobacterales bacterium]